MPKPEEQRVNWRHTNLAWIGSDLDRKIKAAAAAQEPQWEDVGTEPGLFIWRIERFVVKAWPRSQYGKFHTGDSYVILHTFRPDPSQSTLHHDIHIWIGQESSQDEYGTAAYKMVELDDALGGAAVQHRQVQGRESDEFLAYFDHNSITYLAGGVETGFRHVQPNNQDSTPRLYHIKGRGSTLRLTEEDVRRDALNEGDAFILTAGDDRVWLWLGKSANHDETTKGMEIARKLCTKGSVQTVHDVDDEAPEFWSHLPDKVRVAGSGMLNVKATVDVQPADDMDEDGKAFVPVLYRWNNGSSWSQLATAQRIAVGPTGQTKQWKFAQSHLDNAESLLLLDTGFQFFVWIGKDCKFKAHAVTAERVYCQRMKRPDGLPMTIVKQNQETAFFQNYFGTVEEPSCLCCCVIL